jgi:predicted nucleic acid-binding protein
MRPEDVPVGPLLVDTDVFSFLRLGKGRHEEFAALVKGHILAVSFATVGEVLAGGHAARLGEQRMNQLRDALRRFVIIPYTATIAEAWAPLYAKLKGHLHGEGINDLWTAACGLTQTPRIPIVTNNLSDFRTIAAQAPDLLLVHPDL